MHRSGNLVASPSPKWHGEGDGKRTARKPPLDISIDRRRSGVTGYGKGMARNVSDVFLLFKIQNKRKNNLK
ncbi:unnamed protein product [Arabis nemorensis]|uniref:Uncharacterized protein n=1 Tax=Arabis nemorensis TaxID=586526 RepID=A0A565BKJ1_9BRAS|nr:unnamed protein product [Arabis nemorensis]